MRNILLINHNPHPVRLFQFRADVPHIDITLAAGQRRRLRWLPRSLIKRAPASPLSPNGDPSAQEESIRALAAQAGNVSVLSSNH